MAKVQLISYRFVKPQILSEQEFASYKQICDSGTPFEIAPKISFWNQLPSVKWWILAAPIISLPFANDFTIAAIILGISIFFLFIAIAPIVHAASSFRAYAKERSKYFENLKITIINSTSYGEFVSRASRL